MPTTRPSKSLFWLAGLLALAAAGPLSANETTHDIHQIFGNMKHALGWDTLNLKAVEKNDAGRPTLERTANAANKIERRTEYYGDGKKKKSQTVTVTAQDSGKVLTEEKKDWASSGKLERRLIQDNAYDDQGNQLKGEIHLKEYTDGRLTHQVKKRFLRDSGKWELLFEASFSYFSDGDLKERVKEEPLKGTKVRETWSAHENAVSKRKKTVQRWDGASKSWQ